METFDSTGLLREYRMRPTVARVAVLDLFQEAQSYTPEQAYRALLDQARDISLATMYRVLAQLVEAGILARQQLDSGPGHYFLAGSTASDHMLCTACGALLPVPGPELTSALKRLAAKQGYLLGEYTLVMQGICNVCARKQSETKKPRTARFKRALMPAIRSSLK